MRFLVDMDKLSFGLSNYSAMDDHMGPRQEIINFRPNFNYPTIILSTDLVSLSSTQISLSFPWNDSGHRPNLILINYSNYNVSIPQIRCIYNERNPIVNRNYAEHQELRDDWTHKYQCDPLTITSSIFQ